METRGGCALDPVTLNCSPQQIFQAVQFGGPIHCVFEKLDTVCLSCYLLSVRSLVLAVHSRLLGAKTL